MERELIIASPHHELSPADQELIREQVQRLERFFPRLVGCRVSIEPPPAHRGKGGTFRVGVELRLPAADPLVTHEDGPSVGVAARNAFAVCQRRLEEFARKLRGEVKSHA